MLFILFGVNVVYKFRKHEHGAAPLAGFDLLDFSDQSCLLSFASLEVTFLLSAQHFGQNPTSSGPGERNQRTLFPDSHRPCQCDRSQVR